MKQQFTQLMKTSWLALLSIGLLSNLSVRAQSIPDNQWSKEATALAVTSDGGIIGTSFTSQGNSPGFPSVAGDRVIKYSVQGNQIWSTGLLKGGFYLGGKIPGYDYEALGVVLAAGTTDGGVAIMGKTSLRGANIVMKIGANGSAGQWQDSDIFSTDLIPEDLIGTPDGGALFLYTDNSHQTSPGVLAGIRKYDASGNFSWSKQIAYPAPNPPDSPDKIITKPEAVINTPDGGYLIVGYHNITKTMTPDANLFLGNSGWVVKLDGEGNVQWQKLLNGLPINTNFNGPVLNSILNMYAAFDVTMSADGNGYALVGFGLPPYSGHTPPPPSTAIVELNLDGSFKRARMIHPTTTEAFITNYTASNNTKYYAVGHSSTQNGVDPEILLVNTTNLPIADPALFSVATQRTFDDATNIDLKGIDRAGDGSLVFLGSNKQVNKLKADVAPVSNLTMNAPTYNCQTGAITFNVSGGDGSPITYIAPGVSRASATDNFGTVEQGLRSDPKVIQITAIQNGQSVTYNFDLKAACTNTPELKPIVFQTIPDQNYTVGESLPGTGFAVGGYFSDPNLSVPNYVPGWSFTITGLPDGLYVFSRPQDLLYTPAVVILGTPSATGVYTVTVRASTSAFRDNPVVTTFKITVSSTPTGNGLALVAPEYNCATGAITFKTTGGNGTPIEFQAAGITGWTTNPAQFVDKDSRTASDVQPFTLMARQSGQIVTYVWDLKAACNNTPTPQPPRLNQTIPDRTFASGESVNIPVGSYFSDPTTGVPNYRSNWSIGVQGLPQGLSLFLVTSELPFTPAAAIVGNSSATGVYTVTVTASTAAFSGNPVVTTFKITITSSPTGNGLALIAPDYNCSTGAIMFKTTGGDGTPIEFQAAGITGWTTNPNQFVDKDSRTASDVQPFTLMARQSGQIVTYVWNLKAACGRARIGVPEPGTGLQVQVLGNPIEGKTAEIEIGGAEGKAVHLRLVDSRGWVLNQVHIDQAESRHRVSLPVETAPGVMLLQVATDTELKKVKLIKQ
ncbi:hypothetical protein GCM10028805_03230 [Spirosoma harenae]